MSGTATRASSRWRTARSRGAVMRVRLIAGFHASRSRRWAAIIARSLSLSGASPAAASNGASASSVSTSVGASAAGSVGSGSRSFVVSRSPQALWPCCAQGGPSSVERRRGPPLRRYLHRPFQLRSSRSREHGLQGLRAREHQLRREARRSAARCQRNTLRGRPCGQSREPGPQGGAGGSRGPSDPWCSCDPDVAPYPWRVSDPRPVLEAAERAAQGWAAWVVPHTLLSVHESRVLNAARGKQQERA